MSSPDEIIVSLCEWFGAETGRIRSLVISDQCQLLLCASDLGLNKGRIARAVETLARFERNPVSQEEPLPRAALRQHVLMRFNVAEEQRRAFLDYWLNQQHYRGQSVVNVSYLVGLALHQLEFLSEDSSRYVRNWCIRHSEMRSDRVLAWAPHCLILAGFQEEANQRSEDVLARRERNGSWGYDIRRTIGCSYALAMGGFLSSEDANRTLAYVFKQFGKGLIEDVSTKAQALKLLRVLGVLPPAMLQTLHDRVRVARIFVSYSRKDVESAKELSRELSVAGLDVWMDLSNILGGDIWPERLAAAINDSDALVALVSENAVESEYFLKEVLYAINRRKVLIALLLSDERIPDRIDLMLADVQQIRLRNLQGLGHAAQEVCRALEHQRLL
jgi:TIR domain-containing protein